MSLSLSIYIYIYTYIHVYARVMYDSYCPVPLQKASTAASLGSGRTSRAPEYVVSCCYLQCVITLLTIVEFSFSLLFLLCYFFCYSYVCLCLLNKPLFTIYHLRPVRLLRVWISEGLTQADS